MPDSSSTTLVRAIVAEGALASLQRDHAVTIAALADERTATARLRGIITAQASEIVGRAQPPPPPARLPLAEVLRGVLAAITRSSAAFEDRVIAGGSAQLRVGLDVSDGTLRVIDARELSDAALSSISLEVRPVPGPNLAAALLQVRTELASLQRALDRDFSVPARALALASLGSTSALLASDLRLGTLGNDFGPMSRQLRLLAGPLASLVVPTDAIERARGALGSTPSAAALVDLADALEALVEQLRALP